MKRNNVEYIGKRTHLLSNLISRILYVGEVDSSYVSRNVIYF